VVALTTAAAGLIAFLWFRPVQRPAAASEAVLDPRRVAVLYFDDLTPGHHLDVLAGILTEDLIDELSQVDSLDVISRNGVKPYREHSLEVDSIARRLHAGTLVEGSVRESGGRIRVSVHLVDMSHGGRVRSRTLERNEGELFSLEDGLAGEVSQFLRTQLGRDIRIRELAEETRSSRARVLVYRAQGLMEQVTHPPTAGIEPDSQTRVRALNSADSLLVLAAAEDRRWTLPIVLRGWVMLRRCHLARAPEQQTCYSRVVSAAEAALQKRPGDPRALELRGTARWSSVSRRAVDPPQHDTTVAAASSDLQEAVRGDPSLARAWATLSQVLRIAGRLPDSDRAARRALTEDEYLEEAPLILERLFRSSLQLARFDSAAAYCKRGARQFPDDWHFVECRLTLMGYDGGGSPDLRKARAIYRELVQLDPPEASRADGRSYAPLYRTIAVAKVAARVGRRDTAEALIRQVRGQAREDPELRLPLAYDEACVRVLLGQRDSVFPLLSFFLRGRPHDRGLIARHAAFRSLHGDVRFDTLVAPHGASD
jgi:TolB-like protein/tetratricopeptide (TPR) repeat protein